MPQNHKSTKKHKSIIFSNILFVITLCFRALVVSINFSSRTQYYICFLLACIIFDVADSKAQSTYRVGALPAININKGLRDDWSLNFKAESRQSALSGTFNGNSLVQFDYLLTDLSLMASKKAGLNNKLAGGYLASLRQGRTIHKLVQQFTIVRRYSTFRLGHRFAADQAFEKNEPVEIRLRYRITAEFPLNGEAVDIREFYLKINNEYLHAFQDSKYDLEMRLSPLIGYVFSNKNKFEFGTDYRVNSFINHSARNSFWISLSWYLSI